MVFGKYTRLFSRPKKLYEKDRIEKENQLIKKYGLKNKREIWKAESEIEKIRKQAKELITSEPEKQNILLNKLRKRGFKVEKISDVLALNKEDWMKRRLQSIVVEKKLANTAKAARQLIVHKHIAIKGKIINVPSYIVKTDEEDKIEVILKSKKSKQENKAKVKEDVKVVKDIEEKTNKGEKRK